MHPWSVCRAGNGRRLYLCVYGMLNFILFVQGTSQDIAPLWSIERVHEGGNRVAQRRHRKLKNLLFDGSV